MKSELPEGREALLLSIRHNLVNGSQLSVLWSFALAQPLLNLLGNNPAFFVAHDSTRYEIIAFAIGLIVIPPLILLSVEILAGLIAPKLRRVLHLTFVACLISLLTLQLLDKAFVTPVIILLTVSLFIGVSIALFLFPARIAQSFLIVLSPAPALFLIFFLCFSQVGSLMFPKQQKVRLANVSSKTPIVMVVFDEFPTTSLLDDNSLINSKRYPNFARLAKRSTWYRNATTVDESTLNGVPAILTGKLPRSPRVVANYSTHPDNLFTLFGGKYSLNAIESTTALCPRKLCPREGGPLSPSRMLPMISDASVVSLHLIFPETLRNRLPSISNDWRNFGGRMKALAPTSNSNPSDNRVSQFDNFLTSLGKGKSPSLSFIHIKLPHTPFMYLPSGKRYGSDPYGPLFEPIPRDFVMQWSNDKTIVEQGYLRHLLQVGFVDGLVGKLIRQLKSIGMYDRSLIVVTADHGMSFIPGRNHRRPIDDNIQDIAPIPLFIKAPNQNNGFKDDRYIQTPDILPTIADMLNVRVPWSTDGSSALESTALNRNSVNVNQTYGLRRLKNISISTSDFERKMNATVRRKIDLFGSGEWGSRSFRIGPHSELIGRRLSEFPNNKTSSLDFSLNDPSLYRRIDNNAPFVPTSITGTISVNTGEIAVVINGRIRAVSQSYFLWDGKVRFSFLVPESSFRNGENKIDVISISNLLLPSYSLIHKDGQKYMKSPKGKVIKIVPARNITGFLDNSSIESEEVIFNGWAADIKRGRVADSVILFSKGHSIRIVNPSLQRQDVADQFKKKALEYSGFSMKLPIKLVGKPKESEVSLFVVVGNVASEIVYNNDWQWKRGN